LAQVWPKPVSLNMGVSTTPIVLLEQMSPTEHLMRMQGSPQADESSPKSTSCSEDGSMGSHPGTPEPSSLRRSKVQFRSCAEFIQDFVPYGDVYGVHPATFDFDASGYMVRPQRSSVGPSSSEMRELLNVELGYLLECSAPSGVAYSLGPNRPEECEQLHVLEEGDQVEVLERRGSWIRSSAGWLPLVKERTPLFSIRYL